MIEYLVKDQVKKINQFPAKGGVSDYHSPDILTGGRPLDYKRDFVAPSGAFVLAGNEAEPYNTNAPRMIATTIIIHRSAGLFHVECNSCERSPLNELKEFFGSVFKLTVLYSCMDI